MISIVYVTCNRQNELLNSIKSCLDYIKEKFEIIVIDNNSTDDTGKIVKEASEILKFDLLYIKNNQNQGVAKSRNQGYRLAKGDILFYLDDDAIIDKQTKINIDDVAAFMRIHDKHPIISNEIYNVSRNFFQHGKFPYNRNERENGTVFNFVGASHFINKNTLGNIDLYPEEFQYGAEELYLSYYIKLKGFEIYYLSEFKVLHIPSQNERMDKLSTDIKSYSNAFNVKRYFTPTIFVPLIWLIMIIRILYNCKSQFQIVSLFFKQINSTYNSKYVQKYPIVLFSSLLLKYRAKTIL